MCFSFHVFLPHLLLSCLFFSCLFSSCPSISCPFVLCLFFPWFSFPIYTLQHPTPAQRPLPTRHRSRTTKAAFSEQARLIPTGHDSRPASPVLTSTVPVIGDSCPVSEVALTRSFCPSAIAATTATPATCQSRCLQQHRQRSSRTLLSPCQTFRTGVCRGRS